MKAKLCVAAIRTEVCARERGGGGENCGDGVRVWFRDQESSGNGVCMCVVVMVSGSTGATCRCVRA